MARAKKASAETTTTVPVLDTAIYNAVDVDSSAGKAQLADKDIDYNKTYNEVNITLNEDYTCEFSIYSNKTYNCNYEEIDKDKLNLIISSYVAYQQEPKEGDKVDLSLNWKLSNTQEGCESELKKYHEQSDAYNSYIGCTKASISTEITLLNNGLLYYNKQFTKIK